MNTWLPIVSAPTDGTVILTDCGTCCYIRQSDWGSPVTEGWWLCEIGGYPSMGDANLPNFPNNPKWWMSIPPLPIL